MHLFGLAIGGILLSVLGGKADPAADPDLVALTATPDRDALPAGVATKMVVRLDLAAASRPEDTEIGVNLGLLLDTSGSMAGEPIEQARAAVHALVDQLRPQDRLTVVTFDSRAQLVLAPTVIDDADLGALHARIDAIRAEGTTDLAAGLGTLLGQLTANPTAGDLDRIVIVGDGAPNDPTPLAGQVEAARQAGYAITTLGVGLDYDEVLLGEMARNSGGRFHHIECGEALAETFASELLDAQRLVAANVWVQLSTGPGVTITQIIGHTPVMSGVHQHGIVLGELAEGASQEVFVEVAIEPRQPGAAVELLDAIVGYDDRAGSAGRLERRAFVSMPVTHDAAVLAMRNPEVELGATAARAAAATIAAIAMSNGGDIAGADALLFENETNLRRELDANADIDLPNQADVVRQGEEITQLRNHFGKFRGNSAAPRATPATLPVADDPGYRKLAKSANSSAVDLLQAH